RRCGQGEIQIAVMVEIDERCRADAFCSNFRPRYEHTLPVLPMVLQNGNALRASQDDIAIGRSAGNIWTSLRAVGVAVEIRPGHHLKVRSDFLSKPLLPTAI